jgi:hypothetical protein
MSASAAARPEMRPHLPLVSIRAVAVLCAVAGLVAVVVAAGFWAAGHSHASRGAVVPAVVALVSGVVFGVVYKRSCDRHPWRKCLRCKGSGRHEDTTVFKGKSGRCRCCQSSGKHVRAGVRVFQPGRAKQLRAGGARKDRWA